MRDYTDVRFKDGEQLDRLCPELRELIKILRPDMVMDGEGIMFDFSRNRGDEFLTRRARGGSPDRSCGDTRLPPG